MSLLSLIRGSHFFLLLGITSSLERFPFPSFEKHLTCDTHPHSLPPTHRPTSHHLVQQRPPRAYVWESTLAHSFHSFTSKDTCSFHRDRNPIDLPCFARASVQLYHLALRSPHTNDTFSTYQPLNTLFQRPLLFTHRYGTATTRTSPRCEMEMDRQ